MIIKILFISIGSLCLGIGVLGIVLPGLPATPFFILSATLYLRSSSRLYKWVTEHPLFGKHLRAYRENEGMSWASKISALVMMWTMILISSFLLNDQPVIRWILLLAGMIGTMVIIKIKTSNKQRRISP